MVNPEFARLATIRNYFHTQPLGGADDVQKLALTDAVSRADLAGAHAGVVVLSGGFGAPPVTPVAGACNAGAADDIGRLAGDGFSDFC